MTKWIEFADELICPSKEHCFWIYNRNECYHVVFCLLKERNIYEVPISTITREIFKTEKEAINRLNEILKELNS